MKNYINFDGLSYFLDKLSGLFVKKTDVTEITNDEIDEICNVTIYAGSEVEL